MSDPTFASPVTSKYSADISAPLRLTDESTMGKMVVRADIGTAAKAHLAVEFARSRVSDDVLIAGTRPDEWFLLGSPEAVTAKAETLPQKGHVSFVDWTHGRAALRLTGDQAAAALEKVCNIDWSTHMTPDGAVVSASIAGTSCDIVRQDIDGELSYLILCDRSFGQYLFDALLDAGHEFGLAAG